MASYDNQSLYNALTELHVIDKGQLDQAFRQSQEQHIPFEDILLERDLISDENLGKTVSEIISLPLVRLNEISIPRDVLEMIPEVVAKKQKVIAFKKDKNGLSIAMGEPSNMQIKGFIEKKVGIPVIAFFATKKDINNALFLYSKDVVSTFDNIIAESVKRARTARVN